MQLREEKDLKQELVRFLEDAGFAAEAIPESASPSADLRATHPNGESYLLEVKARTESWFDGASQAISTTSASALIRSDTTGRLSALERIFKKANSQLASSSRDESTYRILWFVAHPSDLHYHYNRIADTAYGAAVVYASGQARKGFYVEHAAYASWRDLDAVLLGSFGGLLLNDLSPRYDSLKKSVLARCCAGAVSDPKELAATNEWYYLDPTEPGAHPGNSKERLEKAYGLHNVLIIQMKRFSAAAGPSPGDPETG